MRFLSLFSGIEGASVAWNPLGWECVGVAEVEPFPCAVLKHHYPTVKNLGDVTKITQQQIEALGHIDVVIYGFPCQDLSVAGKRKGLSNADGTNTRSGLFYIAANIIEWSKARWSIAENVPGLFSSNEGRDFASVVGELSGAEFDVPGDGWPNAGVALGRHGLVEWVTLDAQYFGVPQRRRRVFIVRDTGDWSSREPLFLNANSLQGHNPPRRQTGKDIAGTIGASLGGSGENDARDGRLICAGTGQAGTEILRDQSPTLNCNHEQPYIAHSLRGEGFDASEDGTGRGTPLVPVCFSSKDHGADAGSIAPTLRSMGNDGSHANGGGQLAVAFDTTQITSKANRCNPQAGDPCHPLAAGAHAPAIAIQERAVSVNPDMRPCVSTGMVVRRLVPQECEKLQGFEPGYTAITFRGNPAADGNRYKSLGNSMAVPVMRWIGQRIQLVDRALCSDQKPLSQSEPVPQPRAPESDAKECAQLVDALPH